MHERLRSLVYLPRVRKLPCQRKHMHSCKDPGSKESFQDICIRTLKESGARLTKARLALIECLSESKVPLFPNGWMLQQPFLLEGALSPHACAL